MIMDNATTPNYWTTNLRNYDTAAKNKDWLFLGSNEWLLSPDSKGSGNVWYVYSNGCVGGYGATSNTLAVRPSFYLLSSVNFAGGDGTASSPIRVTY